MPFQPIVPTWLAWNNGNFTSPTALTDLRTGQPFAAGGLNLGDWFDATTQEAFQGSYTTNGTLYSGRYRFVQVDSGATAANVKTGTVGYIKGGGSVQSVVITAAGTGQTAGTYTIAASGGYGSGAVAQIVVGTGGTITSATLLQGGNGYVTVPVFTLSSLGGVFGTVIAQMSSSPNLVTSSDVANTTSYGPGPVRPVVFLNSITPGNYGFVQELGIATVLNTASTLQTAGNFANVTSSTGVMAASGTTLLIGTIGMVIDPVVNTAPANTPFKIALGYAATVYQD